MHTGELPTILYGSFAYLLLHDPYLWVKNWMPTFGNTTGGSMSAANAINPVFSLAVSSCGRDIISSQVDRDAYLMDVGKLPADMSLMPTSQLIESDQLEVPSANVLLRMTRKTLEAARLKLESLIQEIHSHKEQFDHGMSLAVALYNLRTAQNAGLPYIHLPLQAMARRLESLRDTLAAQLDGVTKVLRFSGDFQGNMAPPTAPFVSGGGKMVHLNALPRSLLNIPRNEEQWRPQRGLPERAVTLLRTWLFENFLHPYPKDLDKQLLARRMGLSRNQVSNWFINARVRLWKPMVEDMCEVDPKLEDVAMLQRDETGDALKVGPQFVHFAHPAEHFTGAPGNNHQVVELQNGSLVPVPQSAGNQVGMFQGLNPGSQSRTSWRADTHMRPEMQTWIMIASGAHQHEQRSVVQSSDFTFSQQHLSNPMIPGALSNPEISGAMTIPLELGLLEPSSRASLRVY